MNMVYSKDGLHLTEQFEGLRYAAYPDPATGGEPITIGYGHTDPGNVHLGDTCTQEQAETWLAEDIRKVADRVNADCTISLTQHEFDAIVDFGFNLGVHALEGSTLWKKILAGDFPGADAEFPKWDMAAGKHMAGLRRRRLAEQGLFMEPDDA